MKVGISLLTLNHLNWTSECIRTLDKYTPRGLYEMSIFDNGSSDQTPGFLSTLPYHVAISKENLGIATGRNLTFNALLSMYQVDYICIIHNDMLFTPRWLENLIEILSAFSVPSTLGCASIIGKSIINLTDKQRELISDSSKENKTVLANLDPRLYPADLFKKIGFFDETYTQQEGEDIDFNIRCSRAGYRVLGTNNVVIFHSYAHTRPFLPDSQHYIHANQNLLLTKYSKQEIEKHNYAHRQLSYVDGIPYLRHGV